MDIESRNKAIEQALKNFINKQNIFHFKLSKI